jgi:hypothetical protein
MDPPQDPALQKIFMFLVHRIYSLALERPMCAGALDGNSTDMLFQYTVKKGSRVSRPQPGCHYQTLPGRE